uniref:COesterase domain-containing protein n=1 Tax=Macrostomum lignano TaxID=282301 RepID=A0A1I8I3T2_9PLAT
NEKPEQATQSISDQQFKSVSSESKENSPVSSENPVDKSRTAKVAFKLNEPNEKDASTASATPSPRSPSRTQGLQRPMCARELLMSKSCHTRLAKSNSFKGKICFLLVVVTVAVWIASHSLIASLTQQWSHYRTLRLLQTFDFQHLSIPCAVIKNLDTREKNLVFHDIPYASFSHRFEDSNFIETFMECYKHYYLAVEKVLVSFKNGAFYWDYDIMLKIRSARTAWRHQLRRPGSSQTVGSGESLSLSVATPQLSNGTRPVLVLVTGNDLVFNKPVMPPTSIVERLDCVVVTVNYRIGLDGAAILDRDSYMGNLFARDITQALLWINHTIDSFGGDAKRVIYFGEGSGGTLGLWQVTERSLLHLPPSMLNSSLLSTLREKQLVLANRSVVFYSSIASSYYWSLFPTGRRNESRYKVETGLRRSLERVYALRQAHKTGSAIIRHYVDMMKAEVNEDDIDYEEVRRLLLYDIRTVCPIQAILYHLLVQKVITAPMYNLVDISSYQSVPIYVGDTDLTCNLPRFLVHNFEDYSLDACRIAYNVGEEGKRQLREYRAAAIGILADFAHDRVRDVHHKQHLVEAVGAGGSDAFESSMNILDHRGNQPGMDTRRSQHIKSVCHELYGSSRSDWHALLHMARYN